MTTQRIEELLRGLEAAGMKPPQSLEFCPADYESLKQQVPWVPSEKGFPWVLVFRTAHYEVPVRSIKGVRPGTVGIMGDGYYLTETLTQPAPSAPQPEQALLEHYDRVIQDSPLVSQVPAVPAAELFLLESFNGGPRFQLFRTRESAMEAAGEGVDWGIAVTQPGAWKGVTIRRGPIGEAVTVLVHWLSSMKVEP